MLDRVEQRVLQRVVQANTNDTLDKVQTDEAPKLAAHQDAIYPQPQAVRAREGDLRPARQPEARSGIAAAARRSTTSSSSMPAPSCPTPTRPSCKRAQQAKMPTLETAVPAEAAGRHQGRRAGGGRQGGAGRPERRRNRRRRAKPPRRASLKGKWVIPLQNTTQQPLLHVADRPRHAREAVQRIAGRAPRRATPTTPAPSIAELAQLRAEKAKLLGYPNYAAYVLYDQMAKTPEAVRANSSASWCRPTARQGAPTKPG